MSVIARRLPISASGPPRDGLGREGLATPTASRSSLRLALVETVEDFAALGPAWSALFEREAKAHQVFQTFEWLWTWHRHYATPALRLAIVTGHLGGDLALVWPLVVRRRFGLRVASFMGDPASQYGDAILAHALSEADQDAALDFVLALPADVLSFRRVRADASLASLLSRRLGAPTGVQHAPFVDFEGATTIQAFETRYSGKLRSGRRRHMRRLEETGPVIVRSYGASPEAARLVSVAMAFKRDWARRAGVVAPAIADPRFERFFLAAARGGERVPPLRVTALIRGGEPVGVEISVPCKGRLFGHVLAPRPGLETLGVGGLLAGQAITSALEQGYAVYDTLAPADAYKRDWTTTSVAVGDHARARTLVGALYTLFWLGFGREAAKTLVKRLRVLKRRRAP